MFDDARAFLFDFDGTLVQPSIDFALMRQAVLDVARHHGVAPELLTDKHVLELLRKVQTALDRADPACGRAFVEEAERTILHIELEAAERVCPYPQVPEMLAELASQGFGVGIVTRNCRAAVERILSRIPLRHDALLTRDDVEHVKPDPRHLSAALEMLDVPGERAVMCGDHPMDIVAGRGVGASTVGVLRPGVEPAYFAEAHPDLILVRVTSLLEHLPA